MPTSSQLTLVTIGQEGHGKSTLNAAISQLASQWGRGRARSYDEIDSAGVEEVKGHSLRRILVEYSTDRRAYRQWDFPTNGDFEKAMQCEGTLVDGAILVVSATDGPGPETQSQLTLARQIGIEYVVVYLSHCELVDDQSMLEQVERDVRSTLFSAGFQDASIPIIRGSGLRAINGQNDPYGVESIQGLLDALNSTLPDSVPRA